MRLTCLSGIMMRWLPDCEEVFDSAHHMFNTGYEATKNTFYFEKFYTYNRCFNKKNHSMLHFMKGKIFEVLYFHKIHEGVVAWQNEVRCHAGYQCVDSCLSCFMAMRLNKCAAAGSCSCRACRAAEQ